MLQNISPFFLALFLPAVALAGPPGADFSIGGSSAFFSGFRDISKAGVADARVRELTAKQLGKFDYGTARLELHAPVNAAASEDWPNHFSFGLGAEGAGVMSRIDPAYADLSTARIFAGLFRGQFDGNLANDLYLSTGFVLGAGSEWQQNYADTGSAIAINYRKGLSVIAGLDLQLQKTWRLGRKVRLVNSLATQETLFKLVSPKTQGSLHQEFPDFSHDWQFRNDLLVSVFNLHVILGKHPYASQVLPRVWNRISTVPSTLAAQFGAGLGVNANLGGKTEGALLGGYYAGKLGAELRVHVSQAFEGRFSTYGIQNQNDGVGAVQRAYQLALEFQIELVRHRASPIRKNSARGISRANHCLLAYHAE